jgi:hypothetical protein
MHIDYVQHAGNTAIYEKGNAHKHIGVWKSLIFLQASRQKKTRKKRELAGGLPKNHGQNDKKTRKKMAVLEPPCSIGDLVFQRKNRANSE